MPENPNLLTETFSITTSTGSFTIPYPFYTIRYLSFTNTNQDDFHLSTAGLKIFDANKNTFVYELLNLKATSTLDYAGATTGGANDNFLTLTYLPYWETTSTESPYQTTENYLYFLIVLSIASLGIVIFDFFRRLASR